MTRPLRIAYNGAWYHVMNRGLAHSPIFVNDDHRQCFLDLLFEIHNRYHVEIHAYCLMNNHYHLLIRTPLGNISRVMRHLDGVYTQRFNSSVKRDGPLFRGRYKSILVDADTYLLRLSRYIHLNPVKASLVRKAEQFPWSSYQAYLSGISPAWLNTNYTLRYFGDDGQRTKYKTFVEEGIDKEIEQFYKKLKNIPILGADAFTKTVVEKYLKEQHKIDAIPEHKHLIAPIPVNIGSIIQSVASFYCINTDTLLLKQKRNRNQPRAIVIYLSHIIGQYSFPQVSLHFPNISSSGIARAYHRLQMQLKNNEQLRLEIEILEKIVLDMSIVRT